MVWRCCTFGCRNRGGQRLGLGFYRFPFKNEGRLRRWIQAVRREDWQPSKYSRICGDHFVSCLLEVWKSQLSEGAICFYCRQAC